MPSQQHETLIELFRERPGLAADLLDGPLHGDLPKFDEASLYSAELNVVTPVERRADAVVTLTREGVKVLAVVVEVQLRADTRKLLTWPTYVANLYDRLGCPVTLLVICPNQRVADWARKPIALGPPGSVVTPVAVGPGQIPVITDTDDAQEHPELMLLSALAHADRQASEQLFEALFAAFHVLEPSRAAGYHDFVLAALSPTTRKQMEELMTTTKSPYLSEWAQRQYATGKAEGKAEAEAEALLTFLAAKGVAIPDEARSVISACTDHDQLLEWIRRAVTAEKVEDLGGALSA
ncbi:hypothetical protein [Actinoplanes derwentensis]|uniref:Uncharacterized protein n=1 Tax=Actinoplanes derwentensis TaxID=113562 RepID=A0A1H2D3X3_9ACTN|nr:hypothetical protein [Actinoplanes derwentensis]GID86014.1 hypothetical protein Ade03nite_49380 [Actinoplanes derwentensis]SDT77460.1 hypothetical protein SAMN04489716_7967 [Actinoplanes derwentensis]